MKPGLEVGLMENFSLVLAVAALFWLCPLNFFDAPSPTRKIARAPTPPQTPNGRREVENRELMSQTAGRGGVRSAQGGTRGMEEKRRPGYLRSPFSNAPEDDVLSQSRLLGWRASGMDIIYISSVAACHHGVVDMTTACCCCCCDLNAAFLSGGGSSRRRMRWT